METLTVTARLSRIGGFGGLMCDLFRAGVSMEFVDEVSAFLIPGKAAVIADVDRDVGYPDRHPPVGAAPMPLPSLIEFG